MMMKRSCTTAQILSRRLARPTVVCTIVTQPKHSSATATAARFHRNFHRHHTSTFSPLLPITTANHRSHQQQHHSFHSLHHQPQQQQTSSSSSGGGGIQNPYIKSLRKFFLKVHPDFFHEQPSVQSTNQKSFQELNEMLTWLDDYTEVAAQMEKPTATTRGHLVRNVSPPENRSFVFYSRPNLNEDTNSPTQGVPAQKIESRLEVPSSFVPDFSRKSVRTITKQIDDCILSLLSQAGIAKPDFESRATTSADGTTTTTSGGGWIFNDEPLFDGENEEEEDGEDFEDEDGEDAFYRRDRRMRRLGGASTRQRVNAEALRQEFRMALINNTQNKSIEKMKRGEWWWDDDLPSVDTLVENGMLYLSRDLSLVQSQEALESLRRHLANMEFHRWSTIPVMIGATSGQYVPNEPAPGFITIPYDFEPKDFVRFLDRCLDQVNSQRRSTRERAKRIQSLKHQVEQELKLSKLSWNEPFVINAGGTPPEQQQQQPSKVVAHVKSTQVLQCLESLVKALDDLQLIYGKNLVGAHLMIGDSYKVSATDGCIMIKWDMQANEDSNELVDFLEYLGAETVKNCSRLALTMKQITEESTKIGNEIIDRLGCEALDVVSHSDTSMAVKYTFLKKLEQQLLFLSRYVWTDYLFVMTDDDLVMGRGKLKGVRIDTDEKRVLLPAEFTEESLIKAVNDWDEKMKKKMKGQSDTDEADFNNDFIKGIQLMNQLVELELNDPDFVEFYGTDVLSKLGKEATRGESDEDDPDLIDTKVGKDIEFDADSLERLGKQTMKQAYQMHDLYLEEKKMIQEYRESMIKRRTMELQRKLKRVTDEETRMELIDEHQRFIRSKERALEFRRADVNGKIHIITQAVCDDITRIYESRLRENRRLVKRYRAYQDMQKTLARMRLNYGADGRVLRTFDDLAAGSNNGLSPHLFSVVDYAEARLTK